MPAPAPAGLRLRGVDGETRLEVMYGKAPVKYPAESPVCILVIVELLALRCLSWGKAFSMSHAVLGVVWPKWLCQKTDISAGWH
jgi:hypothetical protein